MNSSPILTNNKKIYARKPLKTQVFPQKSDMYNSKDAKKEFKEDTYAY